MTDTKVVRLEKLWNFIVDNFLIWKSFRTSSKQITLELYNMCETEKVYGHMWMCGAVVEEAPHEAEVVGSNLTGSA
jgi:hypothetical protein